MEELTIGQRIAAKRKELGLSQIELGEKMGVSRQSVSKWEADAAIPEIDKLIALSRLFGVSVGWLLGVEGDDAPEEAPEQTFTQREWEIIDRLSQERPMLPKWLLPLAAGVTALSLTAAFLAGAAYYHSRSRSGELASLSRSVANLTTSLGAGLTDAELLQDHSLQAQPSGDLNQCTFTFTGIPAVYEPEYTAELIVVLGGETVVKQPCRWTGTGYEAEFTLAVSNGYTAAFCLTDKNGLVRTSRVYDHLLCNLLDSSSFGDVSVKWDRHSYAGGTLTFENMSFQINAPQIFRDTDELWNRCELVVLSGGRELGRTDILNRSAYSRSVNFSEPDVSFFTREQSVDLGSLEGIDELEVMLVCELFGGIHLQQLLATLDSSGWR